MTTRSDLGDRPDSAADDARKGEDGTDTLPPLPADAQHTLDQIAEALGVTTALLRPQGISESGDDVRLAEATELLQAFIRIVDPEARKRCVAFVQREASAPRVF